MSAAHINDGGPAFPVNDLQSAHATAAAASFGIEDPVERERAYILARAAAVIGMTLRDYFAAEALGVMCSSNVNATGTFASPGGRETVASICYQMADAMLKARSA